MLDENPDEGTITIKELYKVVLEDTRVKSVLLTVRDGLNVIRKL